MKAFRNTVALGLSDLDTTLLKTPAIGPIYERWFRKDTYYRQDTRLVYLETVPKLIKELAETVTAANGVTLVICILAKPALVDGANRRNLQQGCIEISETKGNGVAEDLGNSKDEGHQGNRGEVYPQRLHE